MADKRLQLYRANAFFVGLGVVLVYHISNCKTLGIKHQKNKFTPLNNRSTR